MAQSKISAVLAANKNENNTPNYMIIWLDKHIGSPEECVLLKSAFFMAMDPTTGLFERDLNKDDIDRSICMEVPVLVRLDDVEFIFQAFVDIEKCYETIEKNLYKRIFFITSGSKGKIIVPSLVTVYPETFPPENPIFIFGANFLMKQVGDVRPTNLWMNQFVENVLPFDYPDTLLARMTREIADYFAAEAQRLILNHQPNQARQYQDWSARMRRRHAVLLQKHDAYTYNHSFYT